MVPKWAKHTGRKVFLNQAAGAHARGKTEKVKHTTIVIAIFKG